MLQFYTFLIKTLKGYNFVKFRIRSTCCGAFYDKKIKLFLFRETLLRVSFEALVLQAPQV